MRSCASSLARCSLIWAEAEDENELKKEVGRESAIILESFVLD